MAPKKDKKNEGSPSHRGLLLGAAVVVCAVCAGVGYGERGAHDHEVQNTSKSSSDHEAKSTTHLPDDVFNKIIAACDEANVEGLEVLLSRHRVAYKKGMNLVERALTTRFNRNDVSDKFNAVIKVLLRHNSRLLSSLSAEDLCPVFHAVSYRNHKALDIILTYGDKRALEHCLSQRDGNNRTALHLASQSQAAGMSRLYLAFNSRQRDVPPNVLQAMDLRKPFLAELTFRKLTASCGAKDIELLVRAGADCSAEDSQGRTPIHYAAYDGHKKALKMLLKMCPSAAGIAVQRASTWTPKELAISAGHPSVAELLPTAEETHTDAEFATPTSTYTLPANQWVVSAAAEGYNGSGCPFRRVDCNTITLKEFEEEFMVPGRPVILVNCMNAWRAAKEWTRLGLVDRYGEVPLTVGGIAYPETYGEKGRSVLLRDWVAEVDELASRKEHTVGTPFAFEGRIGQLTNRAVYDDFDVPAFLGKVPVSSLEFSIGPPLSGANMHLHGEVLNAVVTGRKRWTLTPPGTAYFSTALSKEFLDTKQHEREGSHTCYQDEGEVLYVPRCWGHAVMNMRTTVALVVTLRV